MSYDYYYRSKNIYGERTLTHALSFRKLCLKDLESYVTSSPLRMVCKVEHHCIVFYRKPHNYHWYSFVRFQPCSAIVPSHQSCTLRPFYQLADALALLHWIKRFLFVYQLPLPIEIGSNFL